MKTNTATRVRFLDKVSVGHEGGCWMWEAHRHPNGYGQFRIGTSQGLAHRFAYTEFVGPIPDGLQLDHLCRNRACVNPRHLEPVTARQNVLRGTGFAAANATKTECVHGHPFVEQNTYRTTLGERRCRACGTAASSRYKQRHQGGPTR